MVSVAVIYSDKCSMAFCILLSGSRNLSLLTQNLLSVLNLIHPLYTPTSWYLLRQRVFVIVTATTYTVPLQYLDSLSAFSSLSSMLASRSSMGLGKTLLNRGFRGYTTSTTPKMKAYAPTADYGYAHHHPHQQGKPSRSGKGDFVPVYVAIGMIALSTGLGLHTAWQQLRNSPTVRVKKQRRETLPEVVEPEHVVEEADKFFKHSFFRKVAHVQGLNNPDNQIIPDPIRKDAYAYRPRVETLKSVGVDPSHV